MIDETISRSREMRTHSESTGAVDATLRKCCPTERRRKLTDTSKNALKSSLPAEDSYSLKFITSCRMFRLKILWRCMKR